MCPNYDKTFIGLISVH